MTREEALDTMGATLDDWIDKKNMHMIIDKIYVEHEAQMKALKDENLAETEIFNKVVKAKDEYIKTLECRAYHAEGYINDLHNNPRVKRFYDKKARSIVAMLFWEWRKAETRYQAEWSNRRDNRQLSLLSISSSKAEVLFKQAYKMLKDKS